jgi:hypothetical protein
MLLLFSSQMSLKQFVCPQFCVSFSTVSTYAPFTQVALWNQKLAGSADSAVVWDYHVVLILRLGSDKGARGETADCTATVGPERDLQTWIYDYDTILPKPCPWKGASSMSGITCQPFTSERVLSTDYVLKTFRTDEEVPPQYRRLAFPTPDI